MTAAPANDGEPREALDLLPPQAADEGGAGQARPLGSLSVSSLAHVLDLKRLSTLREVARGASFAAAAKALSFTPSAVSQQMAGLERDTGCVLFERTSRGMRLADAGAALLGYADAMFADLADAAAELDAISGGRAGRLRLGSFPTATASFVAGAIERFRTGRPEVRLQFSDGEPYESVARLKARELDLAVMFDFDHWTATTDYDSHTVGGADGELQLAHLFDDPFRLVMPREHRLAALDGVGLVELADERIVGSPSSCPPWGADLRDACHARGFEPRFEPCYRTVDFAAMQAIVATGRGLTLVPELALGGLRRDLVARPLESAPVRHVRIAMLADAYHSPACLAMLDILCELASQAHGRASLPSPRERLAAAPG